MRTRRTAASKPNRRRAAALAALLGFAAFAATAQEAPGFAFPGEVDIAPVTDEELEDFTVAFYEVQILQAQLDEEVNEVLDEAELDVQRFYEINELAQKAEGEPELPGVTDDELEAYQDTLGELIDIQTVIQTRMIEAVEDQEMEVERFNEIILALRTDEELVERLRPLLEKHMEEAQKEENSEF